MSAIYVLFVHKNVAKYKDSKGACGYQEAPKPEIYGSYTSKKKAKKNIRKALIKARADEMQSILKQTSQPITITELEWPFEYKYKGFKFKVLMRVWDPNVLKYVDVKMCISCYCSIEKFVVD